MKTMGPYTHSIN